MIKNKLFNALTIALILFQALAPIGALAATSTNQPDYVPGSVVTISGDNSDGVGYLAGETVHVDVTGPNSYTAACDATADDNGAWSCQELFLYCHWTDLHCFSERWIYCHRSDYANSGTHTSADRSADCGTDSSSYPGTNS